MRRPNTPPATQPVRGREDRDVEEVRLPAVGERDDVIFAALARLGVCFYYATGVKCPFTGGGQRCKFTHENEIVPKGMYKSQTPADRAAVATLQFRGEVDAESCATSSTDQDSA